MRPNATRYAADVMKQQYYDDKSDHLARLNALHIYIHRRIKSAGDEDKLARWCRMSFINPKVAEQVVKMRNSLMTSVSKRMLDSGPVPALEPSDPDFGLKIRRSLAAGFYHKAAYLDRRGTYKTVHDNQPVLLDPDSCLVGEKYGWAICDHISFTGVQYMKYVTAIDPVWIVVSCGFVLSGRSLICCRTSSISRTNIWRTSSMGEPSRTHMSRPPSIGPEPQGHHVLRSRYLRSERRCLPQRTGYASRHRLLQLLPCGMLSISRRHRFLQFLPPGVRFRHRNYCCFLAKLHGQRHRCGVSTLSPSVREMI